MKNKSSIFSIFKEFISKFPKQFSLLFILLLIEGISAALSIVTVIPIADYIIDPALNHPSKITRFIIYALKYLKYNPSFFVFGTLFFITNFLKGILEVSIRYAILKIKYKVVRTLFGEALVKFFKAKWGFFSGGEQGKILNTLNNELNTIGDTLGHIATLFAQIIQLCIYLAVPIVLNPKLTITAISLALLFGTPLLFLNKLSYRLGKKNTETANEALGILTEIMSSARLILGYGNQLKSKDRFITAFDNHTKVTLKSQVLSSAIPKFFTPMGMMAVLIAIGIAISENVNISEMAAILWSLIGAIPILSSILQGNISIRNFIPSYEQLVELQKKATELEEVDGTVVFEELRNCIEFRNVDFTYPDRISTLKNINISLFKGQMIALIGESGSGKSTITDLLLGLQTPDYGEIYLDDIQFNSWNKNSFRSKIGYVPQDPQLFNTTIRENLLWACSTLNEKDIWNSLELANAANFVKQLPQGLDTIVGDRGIRLSGGQRQRIALARALCRQPELIILDEATSSLDTESESLIQDSLEKINKKTTILVVAHRLSTIKNADMVYVVNSGSIVEKGSYMELSLKIGSKLNSMLINQNQLFNKI
jgi:ATP-binding cassette subfamily B protein